MFDSCGRFFGLIFTIFLLKINQMAKLTINLALPINFMFVKNRDEYYNVLRVEYKGIVGKFALITQNKDFYLIQFG